MLVTYKDKGKGRTSKTLRAASLRQHSRRGENAEESPRARVANFLQRARPTPTRVSLDAAASDSSSTSSAASESALSTCSSSTGHGSLPPSASQYEEDNGGLALREYRRQSKKQKRRQRQQQQQEQQQCEGYAADGSLALASSEVLSNHRAAMVSPRAAPARVPESAAGSGGVPAAAAVLPTWRLNQLTSFRSDMSWTVLSYPVATREETAAGPGAAAGLSGKGGVDDCTADHEVDNCRADHENKRRHGAGRSASPGGVAGKLSPRAPLGESKPKPPRNLEGPDAKSSSGGATKKRRRQTQAWAGPKLTVGREI